MKWIIQATLVFTLFSCGKAQENNAQEIYDEFWTYVDQNYIYFDQKGVDWNEIYDKYSGSINESTTEEELFNLMDASLLELKDAHNIIYSENKRSQQFDFRKGFDIYFSENVVKTNYVKDSIGQLGNLYLAKLNDTIGYIYLPKFEEYYALDKALYDFQIMGMKRIIIDVRNNGGGDSNQVPREISGLVNQPTYLGAYVEKIGPGHSEISREIGIYAQPSNWKLEIPVFVLINRGCYSATSYFAAMVKGLQNVKLVGQITGGGGGGNLGFQLSNGWLVAVSVSDFVDKVGKSIENGVEPDIYVENTAEDIESFRDMMLEKAMFH